MDLRIRGRGAIIVAVTIGILLVLEQNYQIACANYVFPVEHRFKGRQDSLLALKNHDVRRRGRILSAVDINIGGNGHPSEAGLYYARLSLGSPPKDYYVQVDTGSDILWINCIECSKCPTKSELGVKLSLYDPKESKSSSLITCDQEFCSSAYDGGPIPGCTSQLPCQYNIVYGDGSATAGYFVKDYLTFNQVSGNLHTTPENSSIIFGCGAKQSGGLGSSDEAVDGILGFGQANSSVISQLASSGKVKKVFSHCLDNTGGGGIFAIGEVVQPKVKTTPLIRDKPHYNVIMQAIEVGNDFLQLPSDSFDSDSGRGTIIDSGTTLSYLPDEVYDGLMEKVMAQQPGLKLHLVEDQFTCFQFTGNVDDGFPTIKLHFENSLDLEVYPHDYLFQIRDDLWCVGWQKSAMQSKDGKDMTLLGDLVLSNKLVVYDLENHAIGWTEYNCSSSIKVKDEKTGAVYSVGAHNISRASSLVISRTLSAFFLSLLLVAALKNFL